MLGSAPVRRLVGKNCVVRGGIFENLEKRHLNVVSVWTEIGSVSAVPDVCPEG